MKKGDKPDFMIRIPSLGKVFPCGSDEFLSTAMRRAGLFKGGCRGGGCGICKARVVSGEVSLDKMSREHVTREEEAEGHILACRAKPKSGVTLELMS